LYQGYHLSHALLGFLETATEVGVFDGQYLQTVNDGIVMTQIQEIGIRICTFRVFWLVRICCM